MTQFHWWIYCLDCQQYMELGRYDYQKNHFQGPRDRNRRRIEGDWALRRFLEVHTNHKMGLINDGEDEDVEGTIARSNLYKVTPDTPWCMVFRSEDDILTASELPESAERPHSDGRVAISVLTLKRPQFLLQCLTALMDNDTNFTLYLTNQGDSSKGTTFVCEHWRNRDYVHYIYNDPPLFPGAARAKVFQLAHDMSHEYVVTVDDDSCLFPNAIDNLVKVADEHPEYHAISGFFINRVEKYLLGGSKNPETKIHENYKYMEGIHEADYISNGFRLIRLNPLVLPDPNYTVGYTDWDYACQLEEKQLRMAVTGEAGGYHKHMRNVEGIMVPAFNPLRYKVRDRERTQRMRDYFYSKWGYDPV